ncbi:MAG: hypothetical protein MN733_13075, partial [Nitrososphaera sp.]|nr:hypothetical protein [Nitrososphaera sp.]
DFLGMMYALGGIVLRKIEFDHYQKLQIAKDKSHREDKEYLDRFVSHRKRHQGKMFFLTVVENASYPKCEYHASPQCPAYVRSTTRKFTGKLSKDVRSFFVNGVEYIGSICYECFDSKSLDPSFPK